MGFDRVRDDPESDRDLLADEEWIKAETLAVEVGVLRRARVRQVLDIVSP